MSEVLAVYITGGLNGRVIKSNKSYVVVDKATRIVLDASDKSLIGKTYEGSPRLKKGKTRGTASIPQLPLPFKIALWTRRAFFTHESVVADLPPGAEITVDVFPKTKGRYQFVWAMTFGDLVNPLVSITHEVRPMMKWHEDPFILSIVDTVYPLCVEVSAESPHRNLIKNEDTVTVTIEATFWMVETDSEGAHLIRSLFKKQEEMTLMWPKFAADLTKGIEQIKGSVNKLEETIKKLEETIRGMRIIDNS